MKNYIYSVTETSNDQRRGWNRRDNSQSNLQVCHFSLPQHELHGLVEVARETVASKERQWGSKDIHKRNRQKKKWQKFKYLIFKLLI